MKSRKALTVKDAWELYNMAVLASCKKKDQIHGKHFNTHCGNAPPCLNTLKLTVSLPQG